MEHLTQEQANVLKRALTKIIDSLVAKPEPPTHHDGEPFTGEISPASAAHFDPAQFDLVYDGDKKRELETGDRFVVDFSNPKYNGTAAFAHTDVLCEKWWHLRQVPKHLAGESFDEKYE